MARLKSLPNLQIIQGFKGVIDFYVRNGVPCARRWPRYRPANQTEPTKAAAAVFGSVIRNYHLLGEDALNFFVLDAADQTRTPRDIYASATLGHLHERTPPVPPPPPEVIVHTGSYLNAERAGYSISLYAWKGNIFKAFQAMKFHAIGAKADIPQGITVKFGLFTEAAGLIASVVYKSDPIAIPAVLDVNPSECRVWAYPDPPWEIAANTTYFLMVGRTDGADNYAFPLSSALLYPPAPFPAHEVNPGWCRCAKADPQVGDVVESGAGGSHLLVTWEHV